MGWLSFDKGLSSLYQLSYQGYWLTVVGSLSNIPLQLSPLHILFV